jgi:DNA-directed RNA polymerase subunit RPC12/RpoP
VFTVALRRWLTMTQCPGQDMRKLRVALYKCQNCGAEVELFSDELKIKCHKCGQYVYKEKMPSCIGARKDGKHYKARTKQI